MEHHVLVYGNPELLSAVEKMRPDIKVMPEAETEDECKLLLQHLQPKVMAFEESDFRPATIQLAKEAHADVYVDRLGKQDQAEAWSAAIEQGATGIQTDHPAELVQFLEQRHKSH
jgi:glycerophosphoryl diester phosphodiesterase